MTVFLTKSRGLPGPRSQTISIAGTSTNVYDNALLGKQLTNSFRNTAFRWRIAHGRPVGLGFTTYSARFLTGGGEEVHEDNSTSSVTRKFDGMVYPFKRSYQCSAIDFILPSTGIELDAIGSTLMSRALPTNPIAGLSVFLGELRDLPKVPGTNLLKGLGQDPRHWKKRTQFYRSLAKNGSKEYLNTVFGWEPFVRDIAKFMAASKHADKVIARFERNAQQQIKRTRRLKTVTAKSYTISNNSTYGTPTTLSWAYKSSSKLHTEVYEERKRWFEGCFTYYLPPANATGFDAVKRREQILNHLYGSRVTPHTLWSLAPWSWAVDWKGNIGDVVKNWSAFTTDGLVLKWGYVMEKSTRRTIYSVPDLTFKSGKKHTGKQIIEAITKSRRVATPYGFGLSSGDFSAKQLAIIAALGISRT
jgi:hypothetical protein